ncbi:Serine/threonine-protein kinase ppk34 [Trichoderma ghanense]|uniref:Serine/threonine-protein kinase ppk34 n=1 Tax=Trichoderma ghanense TaxID=65468 RepID=A0ABY2HF14_9HYPO
MVSGATESTHESNSFTRVLEQQLAEAHGPTVDLGPCVHFPNQQTVEDEDTTQRFNSINSIAHIPDGQAAQAQATAQGIAPLMHDLDPQAIESGESTQEFTVPPHGPQLQDAIHDFPASASTDIPDRQPIGDDESTQGLTASTIIRVPDGRVIGDQEAAQDFPAPASTDIPDRQAFSVEGTTQEFTASTIIQTADRQVLGDDETTQEATALRHVSDRETIEDEETTQEHTASHATHMTERRAIGHEETTQGLTGSKRNTDVSGAAPESTASSSTHHSGRHAAAQAHDTAQEDPVSTSFAANLPDRQVVEADAPTPPPPLTITTQGSSALTHVTGTQAMEARQEGNQPRRAGPASHAASIEEVAATSSSPEVRTESQSTKTPKRDDDQQSGLSKEIISVSMTVPSARLIIAYNRRFIANDEGLSKHVVRHPRTASGWDLISVVQGAEHADFVINLSYHNRPVEEAVGRFIPFSLSLQLTFQPASDNCVLSNRGGAKFHLEHLEAVCSCARNSIDSMQCHVLIPGIWRILTRGEKPHEDEEYSLVQWLILPRKFRASVNGESTKRQKLSGSSLARKYQDTTVLIKDLEDGQSARIRPVPGDVADYELQRIKHIASTASASVFACRHSKVVGALAVKVADYDSKSVDHLETGGVILANMPSCEPFTPSRLESHAFFPHTWQNHIVSLEAFDGRFLALFMEQLPPSLDRGSAIELDSSSARVILHDISSALVYLEERGIVHHDIKPHNIAHSPARGAVLLDFGQAATATSYGPHGGTPAFLPPEFFEVGIRGHSGDVWALGVTMLYVLGKASMPSLRLDVPLRNLYRLDPLPQVQELMKSIALLREGLNQEDEVEKLVFRMLDPDPKARATAQTIVSALGKTLLTV